MPLPCSLDYEKMHGAFYLTFHATLGRYSPGLNKPGANYATKRVRNEPGTLGRWPGLTGPRLFGPTGRGGEAAARFF